MLRRVLAVAVMVTATVAVPADAATRHVPRGWLGVVADGPLMSTLSPAAETEWDRLAQSGAESVRMAVSWAALQPERSRPPDLTRTDGLVLAAAARGLSFVPVIQGTPGWAARDPKKGVASPPRTTGLYTSFLRVLIHRYGPRGTLWAEHPEVRALPIRDWQIWNEPNFGSYWSQQPFPKSFVRLMRAAHRTVHRADPGGRAILAGMANYSWRALDRLYQAGGRGTFDAVAMHPYTAEPANVIRLVKLARRIMRRHRDGRLRVWITELSFPAAKGKVKRPYGFETTQTGQARRLRTVLRQLAASRRRLRIERVFWYSWVTYESRSDSFSWSGLRRVRAGRVVSSSALPVFRSVARRIEGCVKPLGDARRCA